MCPIPYDRRMSLAQALLQSRNLDALLFWSLENIRYLCGFTGSDGVLILTPGGGFLLCDSRYWTQAEEEVRGCQIVRTKKKIEGVSSWLLEFDLKHIGFESSSLSYSSYRSLRERLPDRMELIPIEEELKSLRLLKDACELALIKQAIDISTKAFRHLLGQIHEGALENELAFEMECFMRKAGAEAVSFDTILATGKRSALPHGRATAKSIERGDLILVDFGCRFQGYHSDETCTVVLGEPTAEQRKVHRVVKEALHRAIESVRPGIPLCEIDRAARTPIERAGYGDYFGHGLGHGVGLAVHEEPAVNGENERICEEGMVFTLEPGIYLPDLGGVRLEDMILVTSHGAELLTSLPKDLIVL